jgi:peptidoglycan L-alanyl-D-glutamate endopeptidase CwlK
MFEFSERSIKEIQTVHKDGQLILHEALLWTPVDFGVSEGHRSVDRQFALWQQGRKLLGNGEWTVVGPVVTNIDGLTVKGKHNVMPSMAWDIFCYHPDRNIAYDTEHIAVVAGVLLATASRLLAEKKITHRLKWGADWDADGLLIFDQKFDDRPHFQLELA